MPIVGTTYRQICDKLYHYTRGPAALNIIRGGRGAGKEICFWLKNASCKNDASELRLGSALVEGLQQYMRRKNRSSLINDVTINPNLVYVNSFTEGKIVTGHMLKEYGNFRLEFDFRSCGFKSDIRECTYFQEEDIDELVAHYCSAFDREWQLISGTQKDYNALLNYLREGMSAVMSIPLLKHLDEWEEEKEWRHVLHQQPADERVFAMPDGSLRMKVYYPASTLTGITCFTTEEKKSEDLPSYCKINNWVKANKWKTQVKLNVISNAFL